MRKIATVEKENRRTLYNNLKKLNKEQFKIFYGAFVHYWAEYRFFISQQNLFNLRCDLNLLCHELDESFPDQYDDYDAMKSFFLAHPYYYMDKLPIERMAKLFSEYVNDHIDILAAIAQTIFEADLCTAYTYANKALGLNEHMDTIIAQAQEHIKDFS